jgi:hypothetical protein
MVHAQTQELLTKLIFPEFAPDISMGDDRLAAISERMRQLLLPNKSGVRPELIEFEAKIGTIQFAENQKSDPINNVLIKHLKENEAWLVMPKAKGTSGPSFY